jgi:hypothetical protein
MRFERRLAPELRRELPKRVTQELGASRGLGAPGFGVQRFGKA